MNAIAISGVRELTSTQKDQVLWEVLYLVDECDLWLVGDARGVDELARATAIANGLGWLCFEKDARLPYKGQGAERSTRMIKTLADLNGTLHAWINKPAPAGLKPGRSWGKAQGSGTWGTVALAAGYGLHVVLHPLTADVDYPDWLFDSQTQLILQ